MTKLTNITHKIKKRFVSQKARKLIHKYSLFSADYYTSQISDKELKHNDWLEHFLSSGWKSGLKPVPNFDPLNYILLYPDVIKSGLNPLEHYVLYGKEEGRLPYFGASLNNQTDSSLVHLSSEGFDVDFYRKAYWDIGEKDPYYHFTSYGKNQGRLSHKNSTFPFKESKPIDESRETVLFISHNGSRTGGPLLSLKIIEELNKRFNTVAILLHDGELADVFQQTCNACITIPHYGTDYLRTHIIKQVSQQITFTFAIANTIESRYALPVLAQCYIPTICLIHEFAAYIKPRTAISEAQFWAQKLVYSADIVYRNAIDYCKETIDEFPTILPQGRSATPLNRERPEVKDEITKVKNITLYSSWPEDTVVILGVGTVEYRKGVDLFISCAANILKSDPKVPIRFLWAGKMEDHSEFGVSYSDFLADQISRQNLQDHFFFLGELQDVTIAYELADIYFLSSRLDPLPNSAIDAMFYQIPVVCFENTTGIAEILLRDTQHSNCVVPYLDIVKAAEYCCELAVNKTLSKEVGEAIKLTAQSTFRMDKYVDSLTKIATRCIQGIVLEKEDCQLIVDNNAIEPRFYCVGGAELDSIEDCAIHFVKSWKNGYGEKKPFPGFHPGIYHDKNCSRLENEGNPLANFLRQGRPSGPWIKRIITPRIDIQTNKKTFEQEQLKSALHIHVYYEDLFEDIWKRFEMIELQIDVLISVSSEKFTEKIAARTSTYKRGSVDIRVVPNRGRDIGPLLSEFGDLILKHYDIIGHVHTKKTVDIHDATVGRRWFSFLLENLLNYIMTPTIFSEMLEDKRIGLVFPDDPYMVDWGENKAIAISMKSALGVNHLPDNNLNFPVGTMFWAKTEALKPLFKMNYSWEDYPQEPLPYDGSMLHAIERLLPSIVEGSGYKYIMTHVPGMTR